MAVAAPRDPGLQPERTALAWKRTALAMLGNALLVLRVGMQGHPALVVGAFVLMGVAAGFAFIGIRRSRQMIRHGQTSSSATPFLWTSVLTAMAACVGLWSLLQIEAGR